MNEYDTTNGKLLEQSLHVAFGAYRWCMDETGLIHANTSTAVARQHAELAQLDGQKVQLRIGEVNHPYKEMLRVRYKLYCEKISSA